MSTSAMISCLEILFHSKMLRECSTSALAIYQLAMKKVIGSVVAIATHMPPRSLVADEDLEEAS